MSAKVVTVPGNYKPLGYPITDAYERELYINPLQTTGFTVTNQSYKVQFIIPNVLSVKLDEIWLKCNFTPSFTSTNGGDTFAIVQPAFVPWVGPSSIERIQVTIGASTALDRYGTNLAYNLQNNLVLNSINRNNLQYMYGSGQPQTGTSAVAQPTRFKLTLWDQDQLNSTGVLPVGKLQTVTVNLWFTAANNNMYYAGTPAGTVSLQYLVDTLQMQIVEVASPSLAQSLATMPYSWCGREWYYLSTSITTSQKQSIQVPCSFKYVRGIIFVIRRVQDIANITPTGINKLVEYSPEVSNIVTLNVSINGIKRQLQDLTDVDWLYELKRLMPQARYCDYFIESKIGPTPAAPGNTNVRTIYGLLVGQSYDDKTESGIDTSLNSSPMYLNVQWTNGFSTNNQADIFILHDRWIYIDPSGATSLTE